MIPDTSPGDADEAFWHFQDVDPAPAERDDAVPAGDLKDLLYAAMLFPSGWERVALSVKQL